MSYFILVKPVYIIQTVFTVLDSNCWVSCGDRRSARQLAWFEAPVIGGGRRKNQGIIAGLQINILRFRYE